LVKAMVFGGLGVVYILFPLMALLFFIGVACLWAHLWKQMK
jgi:hypothetical protein